jgi:hypothetical protein
MGLLPNVARDHLRIEAELDSEETINVPDQEALHRFRVGWREDFAVAVQDVRAAGSGIGPYVPPADELEVALGMA